MVDLAAIHPDGIGVLDCELSGREWAIGIGVGDRDTER
jgi:hypothetical protein